MREKVHRLVGVARGLAASPIFVAPSDRQFDDTRLQFASRRQALNIATFDGIGGWLPSEHGPPDAKSAPPARIYFWQLSRGLPLRSPTGRFLARERRLLADSILATNPDLRHITEVDQNGRVVFVVPYSSQVSFSSFNLTSLLSLAGVGLNSSSVQLWSHAPLQAHSGDSGQHFTIIVPIKRAGEQRHLLLTVDSGSSSTTSTVGYSSALFTKQGTLLYADGLVPDESANTRPIEFEGQQYLLRLDALTPLPAEALPARLLAYCGLLTAIFVGFNFIGRQLLHWMEAYHSKLESAERDVQAKARELAHDFQNTAFALRTFTSSVFEKLDFEQQKRFTSVLTDLGAFTYQLSNHLASDALNLAGLPGGLPNQPRFESTYLRGTIESVAQLQSSVLGRPIPVTFDDSLSRREPFVDISRPNLIRIVSNILTNAIEACKATGTDEVSIAVSRQGASVRMRISDNGCGIAAAEQLRIFESGFSTKGTERGKGLSVAKELASKAHGDLVLEASEANKGTVIALIVRTTETPPWFVNTIQLASGSTLVIVDDQDEVFEYWSSAIDERYKGMSIMPEQRPRLIFIDSPAALRANKDHALTIGTLFLIDHRFRDDSTTGLQLIEELGLQHRAILVTNLFEETEVVDAVLAIGVKLLPKIYMLNTKFPIDIRNSAEG